MSSRQAAYDKAFTELNDAVLALRRLLVTLQHLKVVHREERTIIFDHLRRKYYFAHMNGQVLGVNALYLPKRLSI